MSSTTDHDPELPPSAEEELVAYLDGELDDEGVRKIEARLASDSEYRQELVRLQRAWDCLDSLPETAVDPSFTRSTIEMVTLAAQEELTQAQQSLPKLKQQQQLRSAGIILAAVAIGFVLTTVLWPSPQKQLAQDLPVLENLDLYLPIDNIGFLRSLSEDVTFPSNEVSAAEVAPDSQNTNATRLKITTVSDISQLSDNEKSELAVNQQRFNRLDQTEQARLRKLTEEVSAAEDREKLQKTLVAYHQWLTELSPGAQADLAGLPQTERVTEIKKLIAEQQHRRQRELSAADQEVLLTFLSQYLSQHRDRLLANVPESRRNELNQWLEKSDPRQRAGMLLMMFLQRRRSSDRASQPLPLNDESLQKLVEQLSPAARQQWNEMKTPDERQRLLQSWAAHAVRQRMIERTSKRDAREISQAELEDYFANELSTEQRAQLLAMPTEEMDRELRRLMLEGDKPGPSFGRYGYGFGPPSHGPEDRPDRGPRGKHPPRRDGERFDGPPKFGRPPHEGPPPGEGPPGEPGAKRPPPREFEGRIPRGPEDGPRRPGRGSFNPEKLPPKSAAD